MIGQTLGSYRIVEQIGMGGMATVYKAYDPGTDRYVALKVLPAHYAQDPGFRERFKREAKAIARLEHLHILPIHAYGEEGDIAYLLMRYMPTGTLKDRIERNGIPYYEVGAITAQIADALDYAHERGIVHRDIKPSNVLLDDKGNVYLTDFGIAKIVGVSGDLTGTGVLGTPAYMSPEQCQGNTELTGATDQYSLGIIVYEMLTGRTPYQAETPLALIHMHLSEPLPLLRSLRTDLSVEVENVILKALARDPRDRWPNCKAMADALARAIAAQPAPPISPHPRTETAHPLLPEADYLTAAVPPPPFAARKARRFPGWAWGTAALVIMLIVGLAIFLPRLAATSNAPQATSAATEPAVIFTPSPIPTFTLTPSPTPILDPARLNSSPNIRASESEGMILIQVSPQPDETTNLSLQGVSTRPGEASQPLVISARIMLRSDYHGRNMNATIGFSADLDGEVWFSQCGLSRKVENPFFFCNVWNFTRDPNPTNPVARDIEDDTWYEVRLEIDPSTMEESFYLDGAEVGSIVPPDADRLRETTLNSSFGLFVDPNTTITVQVESLDLIP